MRPKSVRVQPEKPEAPEQRKRFRIERLEERIAPKKGGKGTNNCPTTGCSSASGTGFCSGSTSVF